jgi:hypothetical protein
LPVYWNNSCSESAPPVDIGGVVGDDRVPHHEQGLDEEPERDGALGGLLPPVAASPTPRICFPVALEGSIGHRQEYRSAMAAGSVLASRVTRLRSYALGEAGSRTKITRPGAVLKLPCHNPSTTAICTHVSCP